MPTRTPQTLSPRRASRPAPVARLAAILALVLTFFVPAPPAHAATLDAFCLQQIARFKRPKRYVFVDELPKNATGKVLKRELRETLSSR